MSDSQRQSGPENAALRRSAEAHWRAGRVDEAVAALRRAAALTPAEPAVWSDLALILEAANRPDLAHDAFARVLTLRPGDPAAQCGIARCLKALARPAEAAAAFEAVLTSHPDEFDARLGLALLALEAGDLDRVEDHLARLESAGRPAVTWLSARLALTRGAFSAAREELESLLARRDLATHERIDALLLQAQALDRLGRPTEAFAAAARGKALQHGLFAGRATARESVAAKLTRLADRIESADRATWRASQPAGPAVAAGHTFLLGFPRSGTTLLEQALASHSRIVALEEAPTLSDAASAFLSDAKGLERLAGLAPAQVELWRKRYWAVVRQHGVEPAGKMFLDKAPGGVDWLPLVARLFPEARVLFAVRDPRDVVLSCFLNNFQMNALTFAFTRLEDTAAAYAAAMRLAHTSRQLLPLAVKEVRYESLIEDFSGELAKVCEFVGLEIEPQMTDVARAARGRSVRTPSAAHVREGVNRRGLGRWRAYAGDLSPVAETLAPWVEAFGYPPL